MDIREKNAIQKNYKTFLEDLLPDKVSVHLCQEKVLGFDDLEEINSKTTRKEKANSLINILFKKESAAFTIFSAALVVTDQSHLAEKIQESYEEHKNDTILEIPPDNHSDYRTLSLDSADKSCLNQCVSSDLPTNPDLTPKKTSSAIVNKTSGIETFGAELQQQNHEVENHPPHNCNQQGNTVNDRNDDPTINANLETGFDCNNSGPNNQVSLTINCCSNCTISNNNCVLEKICNSCCKALYDFLIYVSLLLYAFHSPLVVIFGLVAHYAQLLMTFVSPGRCLLSSFVTGQFKMYHEEHMDYCSCAVSFLLFYHFFNSCMFIVNHLHGHRKKDSALCVKMTFKCLVLTSVMALIYHAMTTCFTLSINLTLLYIVAISFEFIVSAHGGNQTTNCYKFNADNNKF